MNYDSPYAKEILNPALKLCDDEVIRVFVENKPDFNLESVQAFQIKKFMNPKKILSDYEVREKEEREKEQKGGNVIGVYDDDDDSYRGEDNEREYDREYDRDRERDRDHERDYEHDNDHDFISGLGNQDENHSNFISGLDDDLISNRDIDDLRGNLFNDNSSDHEDQLDRVQSSHNYNDSPRDDQHELNDRSIRNRKLFILSEFSKFEKQRIFTSKRFDVNSPLELLEDELVLLQDTHDRNKFVERLEIALLFIVLLLELLMVYLGFKQMKNWYYKVKDQIEDFHSDFIELYHRYKGSLDFGPVTNIVAGLTFSAVSYGLLNSNIASNINTGSGPQKQNNQGGGNFMDNFMDIMARYSNSNRSNDIYKNVDGVANEEALLSNLKNSIKNGALA